MAGASSRVPSTLRSPPGGIPSPSERSCAPRSPPRPPPRPPTPAGPWSRYPKKSQTHHPVTAAYRGILEGGGFQMGLALIQTSSNGDALRGKWGPDLRPCHGGL
eukprot:1196233-Prorocentrum_minimum.AAC.4